MVFKAARHFQWYFNYIVMVSFISGGNRSTQRKSLTCRKSLTNFITKCCIDCTSPWAVFKLTTLVVIDADCTGSCESNFHTIMTAPFLLWKESLNTYTIVNSSSNINIWTTTSPWTIEHKKATAYGVGNPGPGLEQT